jgi:DNA-binding NarL/FixJ family response regulator
VIRVAIADDQALVRSGFRMILDARRDLEVVGEAEDGEQAVELVRELEPDVILLDIRMPNLDGIEATRRIVADGQATRILILTTFDLDDYVHDAVRAGASGFLLKDVRPAELVDAIRLIAGGNALLAPTALQRLLERFQSPQPPDTGALPNLTERERETLQLVAEGLSNAEIAERLVLSEATVKTHISNLLRKLGVRDRVQAVIAAYDSGLVQPRQTPRQPGTTSNAHS